MESKIINVRHATPDQLQEAAREVRLQDSPNQVYGLYTAIFTKNPSPMQINILQKGLRAEGYNYLRITETARVATEVDLLPQPLREAVTNMVGAVRQAFGGSETMMPTLTGMRAAGPVVYETLSLKPNLLDPRKVIARLAGERHFKYQSVGGFWMKQVKVGRVKYQADIEFFGDSVRLSAYKGVL